MMTAQRVQEIIKAIDTGIHGWSIRYGQSPLVQSNGYIQVVAEDDIENRTGAPGYSWTGRKWPISSFMTPSEVVQTIFKAVLTAQEHELRELFKYRGESVFDPHLDLDALVAFRRRYPISVRQGAAP